MPESKKIKIWRPNMNLNMRSSSMLLSSRKVFPSSASLIWSTRLSRSWRLITVSPLPTYVSLCFVFVIYFVSHPFILYLAWSPPILTAYVHSSVYQNLICYLIHLIRPGFQVITFSLIATFLILLHTALALLYLLTCPFKISPVSILPHIPKSIHVFLYNQLPRYLS